MIEYIIDPLLISIMEHQTSLQQIQYLIKIDDLINCMNQVNFMLKKIVNKNNQFEHFMKNKTINDELISNKIDDLIKNHHVMKINIAQHEIKVIRYENLFKKLIFSLLD